MSEIQVIIGDKGVKKVLLVTGKKQNSPIDTLALFARLEPVIERFKTDIRQTLFASCGKRGAN